MIKPRICTKCGQAKPKKDFPEKKSNLSGVSDVCRECKAVTKGASSREAVTATCGTCQRAWEKVRMFTLLLSPDGKTGTYASNCKTCERKLAEGVTVKQILAHHEYLAARRNTRKEVKPELTGSNPFDWRSYKQPVSVSW